MTPKELYRKIDALQLQLQNVQPLKPEDEERLWKKFRLEWNYNSNHMEGNTLTYMQTELLIIFDKLSGDFSGREVEEMKAHDVAIKMVVDLAKDKERDLSESFIRELNEIILVRSFWKEAITPDGQTTRREITPGEFKKYPNSVRLENGEIFHYSAPEETAALMNDLMQFYKTNAASTEVHPLWLAAMLHYKFVRIHPFDDGNGRVARLLMNYVLIKNNLPPVVIKSAEKKEYLTALNKADAGDLESFVFYVGKQAHWSLDISIKAAKGESVDEPGDLKKKIIQLKRKLGTSETEKVNLIKSKDAIKKAFVLGIEPLINKIINKLSEFDNLFKAKNEELWTGNAHFGVSLVSDVDFFHKKLEEHPNKIYNLTFNYKLRGFRKSGNTSFDSNVTINFVFQQHVYEIRSEQMNVVYSKLYDEVITEEESEIISEALGNAVLQKIETELKL